MSDIASPSHTPLPPWNGWRKVSGVMCDESFSKNERKDTQDDGETCDITWLRDCVTEERLETQMEGAEVKMLRLFLGMMKLDMIIN